MQKEGQNVALRSRGENITSGTNIYIVDTLGMQYIYIFYGVSLTSYLNLFSLFGSELLRYKMYI